MASDSIAGPRWSGFDALALATILVLGLTQLPTPFDADQATFVLGARDMSQGGLLYRDFWDTKPPGIFCFYWIAGRLFGFDEIGIHAFELIYWAVFAWILARCMRAATGDPRAARLAPLLSVGVYYAIAGDWHLTQVESLVGAPLFLAAWFSSRPARGRLGPRARAFLSGAMAGIVVLFKPQFLPIAAGFWVLAAVLGPGTGARTRAGRAFASLMPSFGLLTVLAPVLVVYAVTGGLHALWWTFWEYPLYINSHWGGWRFPVLVDGLGWFLHRCAPLLGLAALGAWSDLRGPNRLLTANLLFWVVMGSVVILVQRISWWQYHYLLLLVPLGWLAARGTVRLWALLAHVGARGDGRAFVGLRIATIALLFAGIIGSGAARAALLVHERLAWAPMDRVRYQMRAGKAYAAAHPETAFLRQPRSLSGPIFVIGGPEYYYLSGRAQAGHPRGNRFFRLLSPGEWNRLAEALAAEPPTYVFVQRDHLEMVLSPAKATARFRRFLGEHYRERSSSPAGVWYVRREAVAG